jgi:hypothetical protein
MKRLLLFTLALPAALVIGCSGDDDDDESYTWQKDITYISTLNQFPPDTGDYLWSDSSFLRIIWDRVLSGELAATDPHDGEQLDTAEIMGRLVQVDSMFVVSPITMMDTVLIIRTEYPKNQITDVAFKERISYDAETNTLEKEVSAIGPVREIIGPNGLPVGKYIMFWVNVNEGEED